MVVDLHARVWGSPDQFGPEMSRLLRLRQADRWVRLDASGAALDRAMGCVDACLVHGFRADRLGAHVPNEFIAEIVRAAPGRRLGVAGVDPMGADPLRQIESAQSLGLVGISISPMCQGFHPSHSNAMRVYEACVARNLPIFVARPLPLSPCAVMDFGRPGAWDEVARAFPTLPIVIGELGFPWIDETLVLIGKHENIWADLSGIAARPWQLMSALLTAHGLGVLDRILFASGFPHETPARAIENIYSLNALSHGTQLPGIPRALLRGIIERDALGALRIESDIAQQVSSTADEELPEVEPVKTPRIAPALRTLRGT